MGGMIRPSALAVLRLIASSYLVGACTGRSPGFSPLVCGRRNKQRAGTGHVPRKSTCDIEIPARSPFAFASSES